MNTPRSMNNLKLANPAMMDVAVPENIKQGLMLSAQHRGSGG